MNSLRTVETSINIDQLKDHIGALLYTLGMVKDDETISKLEFGDLRNLTKGEIPLKFTIKEDKEVELIKIHGRKEKT